jgi:hypothetical protein
MGSLVEKEAKEACNATCCDTGVTLPTFGRWGGGGGGIKSCLLKKKAETVFKIMAITYQNTQYTYS